MAEKTAGLAKRMADLGLGPENTDMSCFGGMPVLGNKILVPARYHMAGVEPTDDYYVFDRILDSDDGVLYYATLLVGGTYGTYHGVPHTMELNLEEFRLFRGYYLSKD